MVDLSTSVAGIKLKNPILGASGCFGYGFTYDRFYELETLGGFCTKGLSIEPKVGNEPPRICETASGMLNAIGLQNIGVAKFLSQKLPKLKNKKCAVVVNFFGSSVEQYAKCAELLDGNEGISALEMNISCPNVKEGGIQFGVDPASTAKVVKAVRHVTKLPLIVKLSPNVTDITQFAKVCEEEGADAISLINTLVGMAIDIRKRKPVLANITGGLSGPAIKPVALRMVYECHKAVKIPIIGIGGIASAEDVVEFILAGASAVQIGTMNFVEPEICSKLVSDLETLLPELGTDKLTDLVGQL